MAVVKCNSSDCVHCESGFCKKSNIAIAELFMETKFDGVQRYWKCRQYNNICNTSKTDKEVK